MSLHVGHTKPNEWWIIDHRGVPVYHAPITNKAAAMVELQRLLLAEQKAAK